MKICIGADHRGFKLKEELKKSLSHFGEVLDVGASSMQGSDDFVDFALSVCSHVAGQPGAKGILFCGSGVGMAIAANKVPGIRAAVGHSVSEIVGSRHDDDINVLCLSADTLQSDVAGELIEVFLTTAFSGEEKYLRRIAKIKELESHA